jgi:ABC-type lipoprotein export system ATPase subunit
MNQSTHHTNPSPQRGEGLSDQLSFPSDFSSADGETIMNAANSAALHNAPPRTGDERIVEGAHKPGGSMDLIHLEDIRKTYHLGEIDVPVLKGVSLDIARGEMVALMGASGSGKSTLMNILGCLDRPSSGKYYLDGQEVSNLSADERAMIRNRKIGFVFQSFNLLPRTSAIEQVIMPLTYTASGMSSREAYRRGKALLERVGLGERLDHEPSQLSGGQQQRVAIARALINNPPLVFADEPTGNLDSKTSKEILLMFQRLAVEEGITIVLVTHDANVGSYAQRTIKIKDGLIEAGAF